MAQAYHLIIAPEGAAQTQYELKGSKVGLGRSPDHQICLPEKAISGSHCEFRAVEGGGYILRDLDSTNGTKVNGKPVGQLPLNDGDCLLLGEMIPAFFVVTAPGEVPQVTAPNPVAGAPADAPPATSSGLLPTGPALPTGPVGSPAAPAATPAPAAKPVGAPAPVPGQVSPTVPLQGKPAGAPAVAVPQKKAAAEPSALKAKASGDAPPSLKPNTTTGNPPSLQKQPPTE